MKIIDVIFKSFNNVNLTSWRSAVHLATISGLTKLYLKIKCNVCVNYLAWKLKNYFEILSILCYQHTVKFDFQNTKSFDI